MKYAFLVGFLVGAFFTYAQITEVKKASCVRSAKAGGSRYGEWECGKTPGVVDCNDKLVFDEDSKLVVSGNMGLPFSGTCETCHQNGRMERKVSFDKGLQVGIDTTYYESGCPQVIQNHFQGQENGQWVYYFDTTNVIAWEQNYAYGQKHGKQVWLTRDGDTSRFELYNNGLLNGTKRLFYSKSRIEKEIPYVNGLMDGVFKHYAITGVLLDEISYKQGKRNGEAKYFFDDGKLLRTEHWNMDVREGEFKTFYYQGFVQTLEVYKKGVPEGWWEERYPDDKVKRKALYKKGVVIEEFKYDANGNETEHIGGTKSSGKYDEEGPQSNDGKGKKGK
ncbi:MAG: toxin-antitoxin system YwqK family antitoxin [Bacteroidota bacterium]